MQYPVAAVYAIAVVLIGEHTGFRFVSVEKGVEMGRGNLHSSQRRHTMGTAPRLLLALSCSLLVFVLGMGFRVEAAEAATCTNSLQAQIDAAPPGATVVGEPCIYREQITIDKPLTLVGQSGSEIRGSDVWKGWTERSGGQWISRRSVPMLPQDEPDVYCMPDTTRCKLPEQVFFDGKPLTQVTSKPKKPSQFFVNARRKVVIFRDPRDHMLEVTTRQHWVLGTPSVDDVTIEGWTMKHAGTEGRSAALMNRQEVGELGGARWTVKNNVLSHGHSAIISLTNAPDHQILNNRILRGGMLGIKGAGPGSVIRSNEIAYGNTEHYCYNSICGIGGTGGVKFAAKVHDTVFDQNVVHDNFGKGVHYDMDCANNVASNNRIYDNARIGLHMELCLSGTMFGNVIYGNGYATPEGNAGTGLAVSTSVNVEAYDNVIVDNPGGILVRNSPREGHPEYYPSHDVYIHDNTIISQDGYTALAWYGRGEVILPTSNNRGANNRYYYGVRQNDNARFAWDGPIKRLPAFNATPGEEQGTYMSTAEKDAVLEEWQIPSGG
jgi:parallel beta-helix repeat protein